jgi:hypothetical protein
MVVTSNSSLPGLYYYYYFYYYYYYYHPTSHHIQPPSPWALGCDAFVQQLTVNKLSVPCSLGTA